MTSEVRKEIMLEDGRKAERVVREDIDCDSQAGVRITEIWADPKVELPSRNLAQRVVEKLEPVVHTRELETFDEVTGELISKDIESIEPNIKMQVVERLVSTHSLEEVSVQSAEDCLVTRDEMREDICEAMKMVVKAVSHGHDHHHGSDCCKEQKVSDMQVVTEDRLAVKKNGMSVANMALLAVISAQVAGLAWILFVM